SEETHKPTMPLVDNLAGPPDTAHAEAGAVVDCSGRLSGSFYTPMQEFFGVSASGDPAAVDALRAGSVGATPEIRARPVAADATLPSGDSGTADLVQGADSQSGFTPVDSPAVPQRSTVDSGAASHQGSELVNGPADDDDTDSDIVPLSQSRALIDARRGSESAGPDVSTSQSSASNGLGIAHSIASKAPVPGDSASISSAATRLQALNIPFSTDPAAAAELEGTLLSAGRLRFSPDAPPRILGLPSAADDDNETEIDIDIDGDMDDGASSAQLADENSQQACAMGKYLYDIEEFRCQPISDKSSASGGEPLVPRILQGIAVPALADHAEWLGKREVFNGLALRYYIGNYDFCGLRIDECLRRLCSHIFLRGESQVIDRLLVALAQRFVACNPDTKLRTADVAHA
ncbi:hypothetical protein H4R27_006651, partial [Coemansia aciculifera]